MDHVLLLGFGWGFGFPLHAHAGDGVHVDEHGAIERPGALFASADAHLALWESSIAFYALSAADCASLGSGWHPLWENSKNFQNQPEEMRKWLEGDVVGQEIKGEMRGVPETGGYEHEIRGTRREK